MIMIGSAAAVLMGQGCAAVSAVEVTLTVAATVVKVTGAVIDAVIPDSKDKE